MLCLKVFIFSRRVRRSSVYIAVCLIIFKFPNRSIITLAINKCYVKVRVLVFRATTFVSVGKSHSSGVRGLVVRCFLFHAEGSCSNRCECANFFTSILKQVSTFFRIMRLPFSALWDLFSKIFYCPRRVPPLSQPRSCVGPGVQH